MSLEQQLRETLRDAAGNLSPDPARAYERFRRRRLRRRIVAVPAVAAALLVLVMVTAVIGAQVRPEPVTPVHPSPTPTPSPQLPPQRGLPLTEPEYRPGPRTVEVPAAGYSLEVPAGWEVVELGSEVRLRPESEPRAEVQVNTWAVPPDLGPGRGEAYPEETSRDDVGYNQGVGYHLPPRPYSYSRRPDGRRVLEAGQLATEGNFYIAWPYECEPGVTCRPLTKLRTLLIRFYAPEAMWPEVRRVGEAIVRDARPITNALPDGDRPDPRELCPVDVSGPYTDDFTVSLGFHNSEQLIGCRVRAEVALVVTEDGEPAEVQGSGQPVTLDGLSPEQGADPDGHFSVTWRWVNWCGPRTAEAQVVVNGQVLTRFVQGDLLEPGEQPMSGPPTCTDPDEPSRVEVLRHER